jgi:hypothetical protein
MRFVKQILPACAAAFLISNAEAAFVLTLDDISTTGTDVIVADESAAGVTTGSGLLTTTADLFAGPGTVTFAGTVGGFSVNVTTGISKPVIGPGRIDLNSVNVSGTAGTLRIGLTDTDYSGNPTEYLASFGGTTNGSVDLDYWFDGDNQEFGGVSVIDPAIVLPPSFSGSDSAVLSPAGPYSLSIFAEITHTSAGQVSSFDAEFSPVPLPAAAWLFAGALGMLGFAGRRKRMTA